MTAPMLTAGLRLDQAPPLEIPMAFFLTAPLAALAAGTLLVIEGMQGLATGWAPLTMALTHLGTLGFLAMVMMGALYQMTPVVAGSAVSRVRLAHLVHALFSLGVICLVSGLIGASRLAMLTALPLLGVALVFFLVPVGLALLRAPARSETVSGMRFATGALLATAVIGLWMALGHGGFAFPGPRPLWIQVHLTTGLLGWVGGLITAVSRQVVPMFYLAEPVGRRSMRVALGLLAAGIVLPLFVLALQAAGLTGEGWADATRLAALGSALAVMGVWVLHPMRLLLGLARRRRRRADGSLLFWRAGLVLAPLTALSAAAAHLLQHPRWPVLLGWLAIWGWAGMIVHGMLTRIVPFLVWFHRYSPLVGRVPVPSLRRMLPDHWTRLGFALHLASVIAGIGAIVSWEPWVARLTGVLVVATALSLGGALVHVVRQKPNPLEE